MFVLDPTGVGHLLKGSFGDTVLTMVIELTAIAAPLALRGSGAAMQTLRKS